VRSLKVLILEDNPFQLMALHQMLNANQVFDVLTAPCVAQALESLDNRGRVDIAFCDLLMDGPDGLELIRHLALSGQARAVVILSSAEPSVQDSVAQLARQQGITVLGCLQKPASVAAIGELLGRYDAQPDPHNDSLPTPAAWDALSFEELYPAARHGPVDVAALSEQWIACFQPKVSLLGEVQGVEALVRWQHPDHGLLTPNRFMPALENAGLIVPLTWRVLELALKLSADLFRESGEVLPVAVNIAPKVLEQSDFADQVLARLAQFDVQARNLTLEIIEQVAAEPETWQLEGLLRLRMHGCRLSIDDFGTGASNIQRLLQLPFTELKVPAEFVRGMAEDPRKSAVVAGAMLIARQMSLNVVVEGVETLDDFYSVMALGDASLQGYFIARPMLAQDVLPWLCERRRLNPSLAEQQNSVNPARSPAGK
jgi:EAL domain-containing protein (putative c-di-GMP-specific phosphodiesterase class I)/ActR/RegA family two-component response regulator